MFFSRGTGTKAFPFLFSQSGCSCCCTHTCYQFHFLFCLRPYGQKMFISVWYNECCNIWLLLLWRLRASIHLANFARFKKMSHRGSFYNINQFCAPLAQRSVQRFSLWLQAVLKKIRRFLHSGMECVCAGRCFARATKIYHISNRWVQFGMNLAQM